MEYVMSSKWSLMERFEITDSYGTPQFEARGHFGSQITLHDTSGGVVADIRKHVFTDTHEVYVAGQQVAQVRHAGFLGDHYNIESAYGMLTARGHFNGGNYTLDDGGVPVAALQRQFSLREKFAIDIADGQNPVFLLALMLAIEAIHAERNEQEHHGGGIGGGLVGDMLGGGMGGGGMGGGGMGGGIIGGILSGDL
jgi:uncharacterized protein YxjI